MYVRMLDGPLRITTYHVTGYHQEIAFTTTFTTNAYIHRCAFYVAMQTNLESPITIKSTETIAIFRKNFETPF